MLENLWQKFNDFTSLSKAEHSYDRTLVWLFLILLSIGLIMVGSASVAVAGRLFNDPFHFLKVDLVYISLALLVFCIVVQIPIVWWEKFNIFLLLISIASLILVLIVGQNINGSVRWIRFFGINFQPAELAKLSLICYFSGFYVRRFDEIQQKLFGGVRPFLVLLVFTLLLLEQPDLGSTFLLFVITVSMLFIMGAKLLQFFLMGGIGIVGFVFLILSSEYRRKRLLAYRDPFADAFGDGFQLSNAQMAFGQGEIFGRGLGNSVQKLEYLPEAHTDFVLAVMGEEFGLVGILVLVFLLLLLTFKGMKISSTALAREDRFKGFLAFGLTIWIFIQGFINLGVASGLLPTKGLTFPLVSYGGSSLLVMTVAVALLVRIDFEQRQIFRNNQR